MKIESLINELASTLALNIPKCSTHIDNSKLSQYKKCPRKYFLEHFLGWRPSEESHHLVFGRLVHEAMEQLLSFGYGVEGQSKAIEVFMEGWNEAYKDTPPEFMEHFAPKTPENFFRLVQKYCEVYSGDRFKLIATEIGGTVDISLDGDYIYFRSDAIVEYPDGQVGSLEWKTTKYSFNQSWIDQWTMSSQILTYQHALNCYAYPKDIKGVIVNGLCLRNPPRLKKDGTPYASDKDIEFIRVPIRRSNSALENWRRQTIQWIRRLEGDYEKALLSPKSNILDAFPMNDQACTLYGTCPFMSTVCFGRFNPLQDVDREPPGMVTDYWNPTEGLREENKVSL